MEIIGKIFVFGFIIMLAGSLLFELYRLIWGIFLKRPVRKCLFPICKEADGYEYIGGNKPKYNKENIKELLQFYLDECEGKHDDWSNRRVVEMRDKFQELIEDFLKYYS